MTLEQKKKVIGCLWQLTVKLIALLFCEVMQCEIISAWGLKPKRQTRQTWRHVLYLHCLVGPKLVEQDKYVIFLCQSFTQEEPTALLTFSLCSDCLGSFSFPSDFFLWAQSLLLVMLIASRPPAECDPLPVGWLWSCLPKEMSLCACLRVFTVHSFNVLQNL